MIVAAFVPSMMDRSKVENALPHAYFVASADQLTLVDADVFVLDLDADGSLDVVAELVGSARVVGFGRHTNDQVLDAADQAGCDAMARSTFFRRLPEV
ncbi:MAG: hypothetical protein OES57_19105 [Acidimicrobiia bacterium]|nr:hypothetical protein [Acidimicrobiia bacterium]